MKRFGYINENGVFTEAPKQLSIGNYVYFNPKDQHYRNAGFLEVVATEVPEQLIGKRRKQVYRQKDNYIALEWEEDLSEPIEQTGSTETVESLKARIQELEGQITFLLDKENLRDEWDKQKPSRT